MNNKLRVNIVSETEISIRGHGVHTAYEEMARSLEARNDIEVTRNDFTDIVEADILHVHTVGHQSIKKLRNKNAKKVISAHIVPESFVGSLALAKAWLPIAQAYLKWFYNKADLVVAVSDETKKELERIGVRSNIEVIYNSIDTSVYRSVKVTRTEMRERLGIDRSAFVVIGAGQIQPRKRVNDFVAAARQLPDVQFVWIGGMPFGKLAADNAKMKRLIKNAPGNVHFPGIVPLEEMVNYYHMADMFWLPSEQETFGLVVVEAAASGLPVMLRDISDYDRTFADDAILVSNVNDAAEAISHLQKDKALYKEWQAASREIAQRFDSKQAADQLVAAYLSLLV